MPLGHSSESSLITHQSLMSSAQLLGRTVVFMTVDSEIEGYEERTLVRHAGIGNRCCERVRVLVQSDSTAAAIRSCLIISHLTRGRDEGNEPEPTDCSSTRSANDADRFCSLSGFVSGDPGRATRCFEPTEEESVWAAGAASPVCLPPAYALAPSTGFAARLGFWGSGKGSGTEAAAAL